MESGSLNLALGFLDFISHHALSDIKGVMPQNFYG